MDNERTSDKVISTVKCIGKFSMDDERTSVY